MADAVIRPRLADDLPAVAEALVTVHGTDGYPVEGVADPQAWLTPEGLVRAWVAEQDGRIVGHVSVSAPQDEDAVTLYRERAAARPEGVAVLARLFVLPEARRNATGERLLRAAMAYAAEQGLRLVLDVMVKDTAAIRLYERLGWQPLGSATHSFGNDQRVRAVCYVSPEPVTP